MDPLQIHAVSSDTVLISKLVFIGVIVGAVFGGVLITVVCCVIIMCCRKRNRENSRNAAYVSLPMQPTAPPSETLRLRAQVHCGHQLSPVSNPTYQQPKGSVIPIKQIPPQGNHPV